MEEIKKLIRTMSKNLEQLAKENAVVAQTISVGDRHVIPLCELAVGYGGGGGSGEGEANTAGEGQGKGTGGGGGGAAKASPVAVLVIEGDQVRIQKIGN